MNCHILSQNRIMVLPKLETMRPELLTKIKQLVKNGAVVLGPAPKRSPSLQNQPIADQKVQEMASELWGDVDGIQIKSRKFGKEVQIQTETVQSDKGVVAVTITLTDAGMHDLDIKAFNAKSSIDKRQIDLTGNKTEKIQLELKVTDKNKPYVAVIFVDKNPDLHKEIVGSFISASIFASK